MADLPGAATVVPSGLLTAIAGFVLGFIGAAMAVAKVVLIAAAIGTGFGAPIVLMAWWANRKKKS